MRGVRMITAGMILVGMAAPAVAAERQADRQAAPLRMSISTALFDGMSEKLITAMMQPFRGLLKVQTGLDGELIPVGDGLQIANGLKDDKLQVAVMEGIEFAWAHEKNPELKALMIAVNRKPYGKSLLIVRKNSPVKSFGDLKGKTLSDYRYTRIFSRLFLDRRCHELAGIGHKEFFSKVVKKDFAEEMIDEVIEGNVDAAIIEEVCLDCYQRRKPARMNQIRVLEESERFPASVVVYKAGKLDKQTQQKLRDGMLGAGSTALGRQLMTLWQMTGFELVPETFDTSCKEIIKIYPSPEKAAEAKAEAKATTPAVEE